MQLCKYCRSEMINHGTDPFPYRLYATLYICPNDDCRAVFDKFYDDKDNRVREKDCWHPYEKDDLNN